MTSHERHGVSNHRKLHPLFDSLFRITSRAHWNKNVVILTKFSSLAALEIVILTTSSAASDENFIKMTTLLFQWRTKNLCITGPTCGASAGGRWTPLTVASNVECVSIVFACPYCVVFMTWAWNSWGLFHIMVLKGSISQRALSSSTNFMWLLLDNLGSDHAHVARAQLWIRYVYFIRNPFTAICKSIWIYI